MRADAITSPSAGVRATSSSIVFALPARGDDQRAVLDERPPRRPARRGSRARAPPERVRFATASGRARRRGEPLALEHLGEVGADRVGLGSASRVAVGASAPSGSIHARPSPSNTVVARGDREPPHDAAVRGLHDVLLFIDSDDEQRVAALDPRALGRRDPTAPCPAAARAWRACRRGRRRVSVRCRRGPRGPSSGACRPRVSTPSGSSPTRRAPGRSASPPPAAASPAPSTQRRFAIAGTCASSSPIRSSTKRVCTRPARTSGRASSDCRNGRLVATPSMRHSASARCAFAAACGSPPASDARRSASRAASRSAARAPAGVAAAVDAQAAARGQLVGGEGRPRAGRCRPRSSSRD